MEKKNMGGAFSKEEISKMSRKAIHALPENVRVDVYKEWIKIRMEKHAFTPEKREKLIDKLEECIKHVKAAQDLINDEIRYLLPRCDPNDIDASIENGLIAGNFHAAYIRLDCVSMCVSDYLYKIRNEEKKNDGSSG